jgi:hypothetical protein
MKSMGNRHENRYAQCRVLSALVVIKVLEEPKGVNDSFGK